MGIFRNRIMAYSISNSGAKNNQYVEVLSGLFSRNKIRIKNYFPQIIQPDPEDLVVVNVPWDIIRMAFVELPPIKKEEEKLKLAELEVRRITGINEDLNVGYIPSAGGKVLVLYSTMADLIKFLNSSSIMFEPDVAYPNILSEILLINKLPGYWAYLVLGKYMSGIVIMNGGTVLNIRIIDFPFEDINHIVQEETGFDIFEIEKSGNEDLIETSRKILSTISLDISSEIEREIIITVNTTEVEKVTVDQLTNIAIVSDSQILTDTLINEERNQSVLQGKFVEPVFKIPIKKNYPLSQIGLLYRGGLELGKVKSIRW
ncbi:MAG: hypothetical protein WBH60_01940 [Fervidobacterium sp.]